MTAIKRYRYKRRSTGLCGEAACPVVSGDSYYCETHATKHADRQKRRRADAKAKQAVAP